MAAPLLALMIGAAGRKAAMEALKRGAKPAVDLVKKGAKKVDDAIKGRVEKSMGEVKSMAPRKKKDGFETAKDSKGRPIMESTKDGRRVSVETQQRLADIAKAKRDRIAGQIKEGVGAATGAAALAATTSAAVGDRPKKNETVAYKSKADEIPTGKNETVVYKNVEASKEGKTDRVQVKAKNTSEDSPKKSAGRSKIGQEFDKAFAAARKAGETEFEFKGKRYNTKLKSDK